MKIKGLRRVNKKNFLDLEFLKLIKNGEIEEKFLKIKKGGSPRGRGEKKGGGVSFLWF